MVTINSFSLKYAVFVCIAAISFRSPLQLECQGFVSSPTFKADRPRLSASSFSSALFSRKSRRAKKVMEKAIKEELKIVGLDQVGETVKMQVSVQELRKIFDNVDELLQGEVSVQAGSVTRPKVVSSSTLITQAEVLAAHKAWADGLVLIATTYEQKGYSEAKKVAQDVLDVAYGYAKGIPVCFKPTLASGEQTFRLTNEGALSYFVGGDEKYPNDAGFAIQGWRKVESYPAGILLLGDTALSTGNVHCIDQNGKRVIVDKTWGYKKDDEGKVRIILHHSSLPYSA
jgi:hypothetical protein